MPNFRVISEPYRLHRFSPTIPAHRRVRGDDTVQRIVTTVEAHDVITALTEAIKLGDHRKHSITSIEEVFPAEALYFSDDQITDALRRLADSDIPGNTRNLQPDDYQGQVIYEQIDFNDTVEAVVNILGDTLLPGLSITVDNDIDGGQNAMVEIRDEATGTYRAAFADMRGLIEDHSAVGWDGVLSIAKAVIATAAPLV